MACDNIKISISRRMRRMHFVVDTRAALKRDKRVADHVQVGSLRVILIILLDPLIK